MTPSAPLAPWAAQDHSSRGRRYPEPPPVYRSEYQRDRDRIIHSTAFRRLMYKTQVFIYDEGDMYRTRLTHSLEVAQIARSAAVALNLNEPLTEAIALAHDLGHTPFGHAGQDALNAAMRDYGGFEHNLQSLRVVDLLEERYPDFPGLNLTFETREGILKHCAVANARELGAVGQRFLDRTRPGLEAQLANVADEIAYNSHDVDDGLRAGLLATDALLEIGLFRHHYDTVVAQYPDLAPRRRTHEIVRRIINQLVTDLIEASRTNIAAAKLSDADSARTHPHALIGFSEALRESNRELSQFLRAHLYYHPRVQTMTKRAAHIVGTLFEAYCSDSHQLPDAVAHEAGQAEIEKGATGRARVVADYIAGMTDRYAEREFHRLTGEERSTGSKRSA